MGFSVREARPADFPAVAALLEELGRPTVLGTPEGRQEGGMEYVKRHRTGGRPAPVRIAETRGPGFEPTGSGQGALHLTLLGLDPVAKLTGGPDRLHRMCGEPPQWSALETVVDP